MQTKPISFKAGLNITNYNNQLTKSEVEAFKNAAKKLGSAKDNIEIALSDFVQHDGFSTQTANYGANKGKTEFYGMMTKKGLSLLPERMTEAYIPILMHMKEDGKSFSTTVMRVGNTTRDMITEILDVLKEQLYKKP